MTRISVGIAELRMGGPEDVLSAIGLGSCVAVAIWDVARRRGSLAHIMLPQQAFGRRRPDENMRKYADIAVPEAIRALELVGCRLADLKAKIAGGANVFEHVHGDLGDIGGRNVDAVFRALEGAGVPVVAHDTGGCEGRAVEFRIESGELLVRTARGAPKSL